MIFGVNGEGIYGARKRAGAVGRRRDTHRGCSRSRVRLGEGPERRDFAVDPAGTEEDDDAIAALGRLPEAIACGG